MWQRAGAVRLFVEHVTLLNESDDDEVNSESVVSLWKVFTNVTWPEYNFTHAPQQWTQNSNRKQ